MNEETKEKGEWEEIGLYSKEYSKIYISQDGGKETVFVPVEEVGKAVQAERERIVMEIKTLNSGKGGGSPESFDSGFIEAQKNVINLIQNK